MNAFLRRVMEQRNAEQMQVAFEPPGKLICVECGKERQPKGNCDVRCFECNTKIRRKLRTLETQTQDMRQPQ